MTNIEDEDVLEITVYGNDGGGTDTIQVPVDFLTYYGGPNIPSVVITDPGPGGGGGDVATPSEEFATTSRDLTWTAAGFAVASIVFTGPGAVIAGIASVAFGLGAYEADRAADDPPQPNYQRPAGSLIPQRILALPGPPRVDRAVERILAVERAGAVFVDAIECTQGAFLAADARWTERHADAARVAYGALGEALGGMAEALQELAPQLRAPAAQPAPAVAELEAQLPVLLAAARPRLGLSADDETHVTAQLTPALARGIPSEAALRAAAQHFRRLARRLTTPDLIKIRFVFVGGAPPRRP